MNFRSITHPFPYDLAIDLGTVNTLVYLDGHGVVVNEPSVVAVNGRTGEMEAAGATASAMIGRTPEKIHASRPLRDGVIADLELAGSMLRYFIGKAKRRRWFGRPRVMVAIPSSTTEVEKIAVVNSLYKGSASEVHVVEDLMAAAVGAGLAVTEAQGNMIVDIGGGITEVAVICLAGIVRSHSIAVAGNHMDAAIVDHLKLRHHLLIGQPTAEIIKIAVGSAAPLDSPATVEIKGRCLVHGLPRQVTIGDEEIREALEPAVASILRIIRVALEQTPAELSADLVETGIVLTGGGALLKNIDRRITTETGLSVSIAEDPLTSLVAGAGRMLKETLRGGWNRYAPPDCNGTGRYWK